MSVYTSNSATTSTSLQPAIAVLAALTTFALGYSAACVYLNSATRTSEAPAAFDHPPVVLHQAAGWTALAE
ncbi:MAG: hypothetical protein AAGG51_13245 [Cyanobacteria bacterium P01_G01_bin.54]